MAPNQTTHSQHSDAPNNLTDLLASAGACSRHTLTGKTGLITSLFAPAGPPEDDSDGELVAAISAHNFGSFGKGIPLAHLTALQFAYHDLCCPLRAEGLSEKVTGRAARNMVNRNSGLLDLGSVYGLTGLSGDLARKLEVAFCSPWDRAKIWLPEEETADVLRLNRIVSGDGAMFTEPFFRNLPPHLMPRFFDGGELRLDSAVIPETRNDRSLLLSQFHRAVAVFHNRTVDRLDGSDMRRNRHERLLAARDITRDAFRTAVLGDVIGRFCDPQQPFAVSPTGFPIEAIALCEAVFAVLCPVWVTPNSLVGQVRNMDVAADFGLPRSLFISTQVPTRLAPENSIDWRLHTDPADCQAVDASARGDRAALLKNALYWARLGSMPSGQTCASQLAETTDRSIDILTPAEIASLFGLPSRQSAGSSGNFLPVYILAEAELLGQKGRLGPVGSTILYKVMSGAVTGQMTAEKTQTAFEEFEKLRGGPPHLARFLGVGTEDGSACVS